MISFNRHAFSEWEQLLGNYGKHVTYAKIMKKFTYIFSHPFFFSRWTSAPRDLRSAYRNFALNYFLYADEMSK